MKGIIKSSAISLFLFIIELGQLLYIHILAALAAVFACGALLSQAGHVGEAAVGVRGSARSPPVKVVERRRGVEGAALGPNKLLDNLNKERILRVVQKDFKKKRRGKNYKNKDKISPNFLDPHG